MRGSALAENRDLPFGFATLDRLYVHAVRARTRRREKSEVSCCLKYCIFSTNFIFSVLGIIFLIIGAWAWHEKEVFHSLHQLQRLAYDPVLLIVIVGFFVMVIGISGCTGALRENTALLLFFCILIALIFCLEIALTALTFIYKDWVVEQVKLKLQQVVIDYRENVDLRDLIDWVQAEWLKCCGIDGINDWEMNMYFNCSSPSAERCGVPPSCCKEKRQIHIRNLLCGRYIRHESEATARHDRIYTVGCVHAGDRWLGDNLIVVCATLATLAIVQIFSICIVQNLRSDIFSQRARWRRRTLLPARV